MSTIYPGLTADESHEYTRLRGQQWMSEGALAPELSPEEQHRLGALTAITERAGKRCRRLLRTDPTA